MYIHKPRFGRNAQNLKKLVIAIDGPAASGKSTTARLVARKLGYLFIDTGAMYRAMTLRILEEGTNLVDKGRIFQLAESTRIRLEQDDGLRVYLDDRDVTRSIRGKAVTDAVSAVSSLKHVREVMVREQRRMSEHGGVVLEGRDIGTVVFPNADLKIYMIAALKERARRRQKELEQHGASVLVEQLETEILERDQRDSRRNLSPLRQAEDAIVLDTSNLTIEQQVEIIVNKAKELLQKQE